MRTNQPTTTSSPRLAHNPQPALGRNEPQPLLYTRAQAARLLGCSVATLIRAETRGGLRPVRLNPTGNGKVYYSAADVDALAKGSAENRTTHRVEVWLEGSPDGTSITPSFTPSNEREYPSSKTPSSALLERIAAALATKSDRGGYPLFRDRLGVLVRGTLADEGYNLSDRRFKIAVWNRFDRAGGKSGRRTQEDRTSFDADAPELRKIVQVLARDSI